MNSTKSCIGNLYFTALIKLVMVVDYNRKNQNRLTNICKFILFTCLQSHRASIAQKGNIDPYEFVEEDEDYSANSQPPNTNILTNLVSDMELEKNNIYNQNITNIDEADIVINSIKENYKKFLLNDADLTENEFVFEKCLNTEEIINERSGMLICEQEKFTIMLKNMLTFIKKIKQSFFNEKFNIIKIIYFTVVELKNDHEKTLITFYTFILHSRLKRPSLNTFKKTFFKIFFNLDFEEIGSLKPEFGLLAMNLQGFLPLMKEFYRNFDFIYIKSGTDPFLYNTLLDYLFVFVVCIRKFYLEAIIRTDWYNLKPNCITIENLYWDQQIEVSYKKKQCFYQLQLLLNLIVELILPAEGYSVYSTCMNFYYNGSDKPNMIYSDGLNYESVFFAFDQSLYHHLIEEIKGTNNLEMMGTEIVLRPNQHSFRKIGITLCSGMLMSYYISEYFKNVSLNEAMLNRLNEIKVRFFYNKMYSIEIPKMGITIEITSYAFFVLLQVIVNYYHAISLKEIWHDIPIEI